MSDCVVKDIALADFGRKELDIAETVRLNGRRFDCGSVEGYLSALINVFNKQEVHFHSDC